MFNVFSRREYGNYYDELSAFFVDTKSICMQLKVIFNLLELSGNGTVFFNGWEGSGKQPPMFDFVREFASDYVTLYNTDRWISVYPLDRTDRPPINDTVKLPSADDMEVSMHKKLIDHLNGWSIKEEGSWSILTKNDVKVDRLFDVFLKTYGESYDHLITKDDSTIGYRIKTESLEKLRINQYA